MKQAHALFFSLALASYCIADHNSVKTEIKSLAAQIASSVDASQNSLTELEAIAHELERVALKLGGTPGNPTTDEESLRAILNLGKPKPEAEPILKGALNLAEIGALERLAPLILFALEQGLIPDDKKAKALEVVDTATGFGSIDGVGYILCTKYNHPSYCASNGTAGYGLCSAFNHPSYCASNATVGYGLCSVTNHPSYCSNKGTAGYGICSLKNHPSYCSSEGSVAYGACSLKNHPSYCSTNGTLGYQMCTQKNHPSYCATTGSIGYGTCSTVNHPSYCSNAATAGYGICSMHHHPSYCRADGTIKFGVCSTNNHPSNCSN